MIRRAARLGALLAIGLGAGASTIAAQSGEWPTLSAAGLEYLSKSGALQVSLSGQLDLEYLHLSDSWAGLAARSEGDLPLPENRVRCARCHVGMGFRGEGGGIPSHRLRVFADIFAGDHVYALVEFRSDRGHAPTDGDTQGRLEQAYLRFSTTSGGTGVQVGRFASPFGSYPLRHLSVVDPFLRPPLAYDFRTVMSRNVVPRDERLLLEWRHVPEFFRKPGAPPVWDVPYQWGAMAFGSVGAVDLRVATLNSAPSSGPSLWEFDWERQKDPSWVVAARIRPTADWDIGLSWNRGPWMTELTAGTIEPWPDQPAGSDPPTWWDFDQEIFSLDATFARGSMMLRAEAMLDRWAVPNIQARPTERLYNLEAQWDLFAGFSAAARIGHIDFRPLERADPNDVPEEWDHDVTRFEASLGYRLARNAGKIMVIIVSRRALTESRYRRIR